MLSTTLAIRIAKDAQLNNGLGEEWLMEEFLGLAESALIYEF